MSSGLMFIFGAVTGILVTKLWDEFVAKKKRKAVINSLVEVAEKAINSFEKAAEDSPEEKVSEKKDTVIDLDAFLNVLDTKENAKTD